MSDVDAPKRPTGWRAARWLATVALVAIIAALGWTTFELSLNEVIKTANRDAQRRLDLFDQTLEATVERFHYLPSTIGQAAEIKAALLAPDDAARTSEASTFLSRLNSTAGAADIFVLDLSGRIIAASNWFSSQSLVGQERDQRPYFTEALSAGKSKFYATGITTNVPGYFLAQRVEVEGRAIGVAVAKVDLGEIEAIWWRSGELIAILDGNGIVILSTRPDWRYRPLQTLSDTLPDSANAQLRYGQQGVFNEGLASDLRQIAGFQAAEIAPEGSGQLATFLINERWLPTHGWRMLAFTPLAPLSSGAAVNAVAIVLGSASILLALVIFLQRQRAVQAKLADHQLLENRVAQRTAALRTLNEQLHDEVVERRRAEKERKEAQASLVQAAKLASLGQALAGVAHEIGQPVAALTTQVASARLLAGRHPDARIGDILTTMDSVLGRLASLINHLRTFARKQPEVHSPCELAPAIDNALVIVGHKLKEFAITLDWQKPAMPIYAQVNPVHLEQVMINLISNAADAMEECDERLLTISVSVEATSIVVEVADTGTGIPTEHHHLLFDPFFTTKEPGRGLGLGLSISYGLVRDAGGHIEIVPSEQPGSRFRVSLPRAVMMLVSNRKAL